MEWSQFPYSVLVKECCEVKFNCACTSLPSFEVTCTHGRVAVYAHQKEIPDRKLVLEVWEGIFKKLLLISLLVLVCTCEVALFWRNSFFRKM